MAGAPLAATRRRFATGCSPPSRIRRWQARLGRAYLGWRAFARNPLAVLGLGIVVAAGPASRSSPTCIAPYSPIVGGDLRTERLLPPSGGALVRHRRPGPRHLLPPRLRLAHHALRRRARGGDRGAHRPPGRHRRRLSRRLGRRGADAHHRHLPRLPAPDPGAGLRRGARAPASRTRSSPSRSPPGRPTPASRAPRR